MSAARLGEVVEALSSVNLSSSTVLRIFHSLDEEFQGWKNRWLQGHYLYVVADGAYFTVTKAAKCRFWRWLDSTKRENARTSEPGKTCWRT